jgi:hypothetical protein
VTEHSPVLLGYAREVSEYVSDSARFFGWAWEKYRKHDYYFDIGSAIEEKLAAWKPPSSKSVH